MLNSRKLALLVTGIAKPEPLAQYLKPKLKNLEQLRYSDHHQFTAADLAKIGEQFTKLATTEKIIVCTEKDMQRLPTNFLSQYPVYFVPIEQEIMFGEGTVFNQLIKRAFHAPEV